MAINSSNLKVITSRSCPLPQGDCATLYQRCVRGSTPYQLGRDNAAGPAPSGGFASFRVWKRRDSLRATHCFDVASYPHSPGRTYVSIIITTVEVYCWRDRIIDWYVQHDYALFFSSSSCLPSSPDVHQFSFFVIFHRRHSNSARDYIASLDADILQLV